MVHLALPLPLMQLTASTLQSCRQYTGQIHCERAPTNSPSFFGQMWRFICHVSGFLCMYNSACYCVLFILVLLKDACMHLAKERYRYTMLLPWSQAMYHNSSPMMHRMPLVHLELQWNIARNRYDRPACICIIWWQTLQPPDLSLFLSIEVCVHIHCNLVTLILFHRIC